ncbi:hypothetical protein TrVFT333_000473 [Trichoderma virens FT-333]|nr:hypothetical protein TrVFT333_000473 [Trichoderma virens FT-333]
METWTNTELSDRVQVVAGVRTGTSAPFVYLNYKARIESTHTQACLHETLTNSEDEDDDEDDEEEEELWENEGLDDLTVVLHPKSQLAVSCGDSVIVVFYQKPDGTLGAIEDDGDGWKVAELPSSEAFPGTALASFQAEDAAYFVYVGAEGALRFMEHSNNEWKDLSFSSVKVDGATARLSVAEDEQAESSPKLLVFSLADNKLSTIKLGSTEAEILGTVRDREFKPVSDQECGAALGEYLYLGTAPFRPRAFARNTCQEYGEDEESCEDEPAISVIVAPFQALAFDPYYGPYDAFRSHDPFRPYDAFRSHDAFRPYDAFRSFDPYDPFYSDFHHMNMRDEPEYYQARYPLRYAPLPPSPPPYQAPPHQRQPENERGEEQLEQTSFRRPAQRREMRADPRFVDQRTLSQDNFGYPPNSEEHLRYQVDPQENSRRQLNPEENVRFFPDPQESMRYQPHTWENSRHQNNPLESSHIYQIPTRQTAREDPPPPQETSRQHPPPPLSHPRLKQNLLLLRSKKSPKMNTNLFSTLLILLHPKLSLKRNLMTKTNPCMIYLLKQNLGLIHEKNFEKLFE